MAEARAVEARGLTVRYLNIGDPGRLRVQNPPHIVEAAVAAMRDGHNGYLASAGIAPPARRLPPITSSGALRCRRIAFS